jgi:hypothetical protein
MIMRIGRPRRTVTSRKPQRRAKTASRTRGSRAQPGACVAAIANAEPRTPVVASAEATSIKSPTTPSDTPVRATCSRLTDVPNMKPPLIRATPSCGRHTSHRGRSSVLFQARAYAGVTAGTRESRRQRAFSFPHASRCATTGASGSWNKIRARHRCGDRLSDPARVDAARLGDARSERRRCVRARARHLAE